MITLGPKESSGLGMVGYHKAAMPIQPRFDILRKKDNGNKMEENRLDDVDVGYRMQAAVTEIWMNKNWRHSLGVMMNRCHICLHGMPKFSCLESHILLFSLML